MSGHWLTWPHTAAILLAVLAAGGLYMTFACLHLRMHRAGSTVWIVWYGAFTTVAAVVDILAWLRVANLWMSLGAPALMSVVGAVYVAWPRHSTQSLPPRASAE